MEYQKIIHGSENSLDVDAYVIIPEPIEFKEAKKLCDSYQLVNANLLVITDGVVSWCYKGTIDECNNSIMHTYSLHEQTIENPIVRIANRSYALKLVRTVRGLLSYMSRTEYRECVKKALRSSSFDEKIRALASVDLEKIKDFEKTSLIETYKFLAFQLGQTLALLKDDVELFTKNATGEYYPQLNAYLQREEQSVKELADFWKLVIEFIKNSYGQVEKHELFFTDLHGFREVFDCKAEKVLPPVVVFDADGTLMDETHRSHLRLNNQWEEYFDACDLDVPIQKIVDLTHYYHEQGCEVWIMTGRAISCKEKTLQSFKDHNVYFDHLKMRGKDVFVPDHVLKPAWARKYIGIERIIAVYDDTDSVIEGFIKKGIRNVIDVKKEF